MAGKHQRWTVALAGCRHLVELWWPGFDNGIAVDGQLIARWRWPSNNWRTSRSFSIDGVPCRIIRQRTGVVSFVYYLEVRAPDVVVRRLDETGTESPAGPPPAPVNLFLILVLLLVVVVFVGIVVFILRTAASAGP